MSKIDAIIAEINKKYKTELITKGLKYKEMERINFSSPRANWSLRGGLPKTGIIEFAGLEESGKTTTALDIISNFQAQYSHLEMGNKALYVDTEYILDGNWARKLGVDVDSMVVFQPDDLCAEEILEAVEAFAETGEFGLIVLDSMTSLVTKDEQERSYNESSKPGGISKLWTRFIPKFKQLKNKHKFMFIVMNRPKPVINGYPGQVYFPGGVDWKLACDVMVTFSKGETFDESGKIQPASYSFPVGRKIVMSFRKTKNIPPDRKLTYYTLISCGGENDGIDIIHDTLNLADEVLGIIEKGGSWYTLPNGEKIQGFKGLKEYYKENDEEFLELYNQVMEAMKL